MRKGQVVFLLSILASCSVVPLAYEGAEGVNIGPSCLVNNPMSTILICHLVENPMSIILYAQQIHLVDQPVREVKEAGGCCKHLGLVPEQAEICTLVALE